MMFFHFSSVVLIGCLLLSFADFSQAHGIANTTASIQLQQNNAVSVTVEFNFIELINSHQPKYNLPQIAALSEQDFAKLYKSVTRLFDNNWQVSKADGFLTLNRRYPSAKQVQQLLKAQLAQQVIPKQQQSRFYNESDRRYYQQFYINFRLKNQKEIKDVKIKFPDELGNVYVSYNAPITSEVAHGQTWQLK